MIDPSTRSDLRAEPSKSRRRLRIALAGLVGSLLLLGPWPVDDAIDGPTRRTIDRLASLQVSTSKGPIRVGLGEVDLTPDTPRPLAGFIGQVRTPFEGVDSRCFARALTVESASGSITILTADLLLINSSMARAVLGRAGLRPDQVYFTASHTHGGPGGWGEHPLEMLVAGAYDPGFFETLAGQLAEVVSESRARLEPAEFGFVQVRAPGRQSNRVDPSMPTHDALSALVFRPTGSSPGSCPIAVLAVFGAHATISHPKPPRLSGDYPAGLVAELKRVTGARSVLFASGAVGDASPTRPRAGSSRKGAEALGKSLAGDLAGALPSARFAPEVEVANLRLEVDLPPVRLPFFSTWLRFGPALTWGIADRRTHLHALRIGPAALIGFPGDYSGHLADRLASETRPTGLVTVATSFDGDFRGYLVSEDVFRRRAAYETRWMNFYGPRAGDDLNDLARRMVERLSTDGTPPVDRDRAFPEDLGFRVALAALMAAGLWKARRAREAADPTVRRPGLVVVGVASAAGLAFIIDPGLVDWAGVGMPGWLRMVGLPVGLLALAGSGGRGRGRGRTLLIFGMSCALLGANWVVTLMVGLGWALGGLAPEVARPDADHQSK